MVFAVAAQASAFDELKAQLEMKNPRLMANGHISGGQPSKADLRKLKANGVVTVINLRTAGEFDDFDEARFLFDLGLRYEVLEIFGKTGITKANAQKLDTLLSQSGGKTLVHCASGNRVGALMALRAFYFQGKSFEAAMLIGRAAGMTRLSRKVEEMLKQ